jgi:hypothetical protein
MILTMGKDFQFYISSDIKLISHMSTMKIILDAA